MRSIAPRIEKTEFFEVLRVEDPKPEVNEMDNEIIITALSWTEPKGEVEKIAAGQTRRV